MIKVDAESMVPGFQFEYIFPKHRVHKSRGLFRGNLSSLIEAAEAVGNIAGIKFVQSVNERNMPGPENRRTHLHKNFYQDFEYSFGDAPGIVRILFPWISSVYDKEPVLAYANERIPEKKVSTLLDYFASELDKRKS